MYAQSQAISINLSGLQIDWKIAPGPVIADAAWGAADQDKNGYISQQEARIWVSPFLSGLSITLDGQPINQFQVQSIHWPASVDLLRSGQDSIEIVLQTRWPAQISGTHLLDIHNSYLESNSLNWFSLSSANGLSFTQPAQNNGQISFNVLFPGSSLSSSTTPALTSWNSGIPNLPAFTSTISKLAVNLTGPVQSQTTSTTTPTGNPSTVRSALISLVQAQQLSPLFLLGAFLLSLALGSLHAMTPGHGKALVGAYLIGSHGRTRDAIFLGSIVTITHTGSVILLGLITLLASHFILPTLIAPWLEVISGVLVIGFGVSLFIKRRHDLPIWLADGRARKLDRGNLQDGKNETLSLAAASAKKERDRGWAIMQEHGHLHDDHEGHDHDHSHALPANRVTWKSLLTLGISGGLVPCPDAIAILLVAVAINRIPLGMLLIVAFSIGLALVLIGIGIAMVQGIRLISRSDLLTRFSKLTPLISAVVVSGLGLGLTVNALNSFKFSTTASQTPAVQSSLSNSNLPEAVAASTPPASRMKLLYVAPDQNGQDQLFMIPFDGGNPAQLTQEQNGISGYSVSPDYSTILYTVFNPDNSSTIWALNSDGSNRQLILNCPQTECDSPSWYPDSQRFVYERMEDAQDAALSRFSLWWLDMSTDRTQPVFQDQAFPSSAAQFSPNGQWLSYISPINNVLMAYHLKDGQNISVPLGSQQVISESWSPSSDSILFGSPANSQDGAPLHAKVYSLNSGQTVDLGGPSGQSDFSAAWSPDGKWIAIDRDISHADGSAPRNQVWLVKPDGSSAHALLAEANASYSSLLWSPDSTSIIYSRYNSQNPGKFDIYMTTIQSEKQVLLVSGGDLPGLLP